MDEKKIDESEIPEELLESIAGGVLDDVTQHNLTAFVTAMKEVGMDLDAIFEAFAYLKHSSNADELFDFIRNVYNSLPA